MRHFCLAVSFVALLAALVLMWAHRYQRVAGLPTCHLAELRPDVPELPGLTWGGKPESPALRIKRNPGDPPVAVRLAIPGVGAVESLHLRFRLAADRLATGAETWETGKFMIEWHAPVGQGRHEKDPLAAVRDDQDSGLMSQVAVPAKGPAVPAIRLEHLGLDGAFELTDLEITAVEHSAWWKRGCWLLALAWWLWFAAAIRTGPGVKLWQALVAASICLIMVTGFVVPGPWKNQRPLGVQDFRLGGNSVQSASSAQAPPMVEAACSQRVLSGQVEPSGNVLAQGSPVLRIRMILKPLRPLLHVALLAAPALVLALLLGRRRAVAIAILLAIAVECAQVAFGYGFDWRDAADLFFDGVGIWLALWFYSLICAWPGLPASFRSWIDR